MRQLSFQPKSFVSALAIGTATCLATTSAALAQGADDCTMPQVIMGGGPFTFDTTAATTDGLPDPLCLSAGNDDIYNDVWFQWTATDSAPFIASLCNGSTTGDTRTAIYDGSCAGAMIACNDDSCGLISEVGFDATMGATYAIRIGNYSTTGFATGDFEINIDAPILNPANGHFYKLVNENLSWTDAKLASEK